MHSCEKIFDSDKKLKYLVFVRGNIEQFTRISIDVLWHVISVKISFIHSLLQEQICILIALFRAYSILSIHPASTHNTSILLKSRSYLSSEADVSTLFEA